MSLDRSLKVGIISSIAATILFIYFLEPLLRFVTFLLFKVFRSIAHLYTDKLFEQAALLSGPDCSFHLLISLHGMIIGICTVVFLFLNARSYHLEKRAINFPSKAFIRWAGSIAALLTIILSVMILYNAMFQLRVTTSFNQHIVLLAPYISDQEAKLLRSRWTQMKSEQDFETLYRDLNKIAKTNEVVLPENKVYSLSSL